jgi:hypothetical protein
MVKKQSVVYAEKNGNFSEGRRLPVYIVNPLKKGEAQF